MYAHINLTQKKKHEKKRLLGDILPFEKIFKENVQFDRLWIKKTEFGHSSVQNPLKCRENLFQGLRD